MDFKINHGFGIVLECSNCKHHVIAPLSTDWCAFKSHQTKPESHCPWHELKESVYNEVSKEHYEKYR